MSNDDRQHQMDFILQQQAAFSSDMAMLQETVKHQGENLDKLAATVQQLAQETHESINNLTVANEVTRDLAEKAARLAIGVSQQLTAHKHEPHQAE